MEGNPAHIPTGEGELDLASGSFHFYEDLDLNTSLNLPLSSESSSSPLVPPSTKPVSLTKLPRIIPLLPPLPIASAGSLQLLGSSSG